jgi:hypothetical protein
MFCLCAIVLWALCKGYRLMASSILMFDHVLSSEEELVEILGRPSSRVLNKVISAIDEHCASRF